MNFQSTIIDIEDSQSTIIDIVDSQQDSISKCSNNDHNLIFENMDKKDFCTKSLSNINLKYQNNDESNKYFFEHIIRFLSENKKNNLNCGTDLQKIGVIIDEYNLLIMTFRSIFDNQSKFSLIDIYDIFKMIVPDKTQLFLDFFDQSTLINEFKKIIDNYDPTNEYTKFYEIIDLYVDTQKNFSDLIAHIIKDVEIDLSYEFLEKIFLLCNINDYIHCDLTPLLLVCKYLWKNINSENIFKILLSKEDIDVNLCSHDKKSPLSILCSYRSTMKISDDDNVYYCIKNDKYDYCMVDKLIELILSHKNIDVNLQDDHGWTPLMYAVFNEDKNIVELLLSHNNIDVNIQSKYGKTALMISPCYTLFCNNDCDSKFEIAHMLLSRYDIDVNLQDFIGRTALHIAILEYDEEDNRNCKKILQLLLSKDNIDINKKTNKGRSVYDFAMMKKSMIPHDIIKNIKQLSKINNNLFSWFFIGC